MIQPGNYDITIQQNGDFDQVFQLKDSSGTGINLAGSTVEAEIWTAFIISDTPGSGSFTYDLQIARTGYMGSFFTADVYNRSLVLLETKK